jgi:FKBP-type peptidyl-prolyl cis-trans isomerase FklB
MKKIFILPLFSVLFSALFSACGEFKKEKGQQDSMADPTVFHLGKDSVVDTLSYVLGKTLAHPSDELAGYLREVGSDSAFMGDMLSGFLDGLQYKDSAAIAYYCGFAMAMNFLAEDLTNVEKTAFGEDKTRAIDRLNLYAGFYSEMMGNQGILSNGQPITKEMASEMLDRLVEQLSEQSYSKEYAAERAASDAFMTAKKAEEGVQELEKGILYKEVAPGSGPHPTDGNIVQITLEGNFIDGTKMEMDEEPIEMDIRDAIPGLALAIKRMTLGAEWEVYVPWQLAYGAAGEDKVKPFSTLIFRVKLITFR